jgi:hypothetical protein
MTTSFYNPKRAWQIIADEKLLNPLFIPAGEEPRIKAFQQKSRVLQSTVTE